MASGREAGAETISPWPTEMVKACCAATELLSVTVTVKLELPALVSVPFRIPVAMRRRTDPRNHPAAEMAVLALRRCHARERSNSG